MVIFNHLTNYHLTNYHLTNYQLTKNGKEANQSLDSALLQMDVVHLSYVRRAYLSVRPTRSD